MRRLKQLNHFASALKDQHALMTADALCDMFDRAINGMTTITSPIEEWKEGLADIAWRIQKAGELAEGIARSFVKLQDGILTPMDTEKFITLVRNGNTQEADRMMVDANSMFAAIQERVLHNLQHPVSFLGRTSRGLLDIGMTGEQVFADALLHPLRTEAEQAMLSAQYTETFENFVKTLNTATPEQINDVVASAIADGLTFKVWHSAHSANRTGATAAGGGASSSSSGTGIVARHDQLPATQRPTFDLRSKGKAVAPKVVTVQQARQQSGASFHPELVEGSSSSAYTTKTSAVKVDIKSGKPYRLVRPIDEIKAEVEWAPQKWESIRSDPSDISTIAENTGMPTEKIREIKEHLFFRKHQLRNGKVAQFDPDAEIAAAWDRLSCGDFISNDVDLLEHEYFELQFEKKFKADYDTAHLATINAGKTWTPPTFKD